MLKKLLPLLLALMLAALPAYAENPPTFSEKVHLLHTANAALCHQYGLTLLPEIHASYAEGNYEELSRKGYMTYDFFLPGCSTRRSTATPVLPSSPTGPGAPRNISPDATLC